MKTTFAMAAAFAVAGVASNAATLTNGSTESNTAILVEGATSVTIDASKPTVLVDFLVGDNLAAGDTFTGINAFTSGIALTNGTYDGFLVHFDPIGDSGRTSTSGSFEFSNDIIGVILSNGASAASGADDNVTGTAQLLNASDALFGAAGDTFENGVGRRSEGSGSRADTFELSADGRTLFFNFTSGGEFIDNVRVITEAAPAVPVPAALPLMLVGMGGFAAMRRKQRKA